MTQAPRRGPLAGIRVLEFSQVVAGPFCGVVLADLGAEVIKVEPTGGEPYRNTGTVVPDEGKRFQSLNRGKRSLAVDLHDERGRALIQRLARDADVVVINYRGGVATRLGIDYETLSAINPRLVYCRMTGFGVSAESHDRPATDPMMQAYSGLMANAGKVSDEGLPQPVGATAIADYTTGLGSVAAICAALYHRRESGRGQLIDASLLRSALAVQDTNVMREPVWDAVMRDPMVEALEAIRARGGTYREMIETRTNFRTQTMTLRLYSGAYQARDGVIMLGALTPLSRAAARRVLGIENDPTEAPVDPATAATIQARLGELHDEISDTIGERTVSEWMAAFEAGGVPAAPVNFPEWMGDDPLVRAERIMVDVVHEVTGPQRVVGPLFEMSETPTAVRGASPPLGRDTRALLAEAGMNAEEIAALHAAGVVRSHGDRVLGETGPRRA